MSLPGGPADKLGNRYENWWTVSQLVRMLHGGCESIRIEDPGVDKAEFVVFTGGRREWHQAKRSHPTGRWTLADLAGADIQLVQAMGALLHENAADRFVFVSASEARELAELSDRVRQAETPEEFETAFLAGQGHADRFARLRKAWNGCDLQTAYDRLRRIDVRTVDEHVIEQLSRWGIAAVFLGNANDLVAELRTIAEDSVHATITRNELITKLAARRFAMRRAVRPESAAATVADTTRRYLEGVRGKLIRRALVPRTETQTLIGILGRPGRDVALTGNAGGGKTACVIEFVDELQARGIPTLALRLDRIDPVSTAEELGRKAGLEESPALVLAAAAEGREAVLIIDQLDVISTASGRNTGFFDAVEGVLAETRGLRERANLHVVVVCREFDWENDHRLKNLLADGHDHIAVDVFALDRVQELLAAAGFDPRLFERRQLELLRLPQNLSLFFEAAFDPSTAPAFNTAAELFDRYWDAKRRAVRHRAGGSTDRWMEVISILTDEMTRTQELSVPREKLDAIDPEYLDQMSSEGVLTFDGRRYGFGHQSFFDYCFARTFLSRQESLVALLTSGEQHLFRRSQVRQVLAYLRDADRGRYLRELHEVLTDGRIRAHIKDLAFALVGSVNDPGEDEWALWEPLLRPMFASIEAGTPRNSDKIAGLAWQHFFGSRSWFAFAVGTGLVTRWLAANDGLANAAVALLRFHERHAPDLVAETLEPYVDSGGDWPNRLRSVAEWSDHTISRRFFELTLRLIDNGVLDDVRGPIASNSTFWSMFYDLGNRRPEWVPEVIAHWLRRRLASLRAKGEDPTRAEVFGHDQFAREPMDKAATNAPAAFVEHVLAVVLEISDLAVFEGATAPKRDAVWPSWRKGTHLGPDAACVAGLDKAFAALAGIHGHDMRPIIDELRRRDTYIANHLLLGLYSAGADRYADEAAKVLVAEPWRFECGYSDSRHWTATELVRAIAARCSAAARERLEGAILTYASPWERSERGYKSAGRSSFALLSAFPAHLRSAAGKARFGELERKFGRAEEAPRGIIGGIVQSPIERDAAQKMTDDQWLRAIEKYRSEHRLDPVGGLKGGAWQLAQTLETFVTEQPERFAKLSLRFPADANPVYLTATLAGLKKSTISNDLKLAVCTKAFAESPGPSGQAIADVLGASEETLPDDAIDTLVWLATDHPDPDHEAWHTDAGGGRTYYNGDIHMNGINTTRGRAAEAVRDLIWRDATYLLRFRDVLERMVREPSVCVRSCVAGTLHAVAYHDIPLALGLFGRMDLSDDRLLATVHVYEFIRLMLRDHFDVTRPIIERMLRSADAAVAQAGGRLAGLAVLYHASAADLDREAASGSAPQRLGLAEVAAANVAAEDCRAWCEKRLNAFFNDEDESVRKEAASCFRQLRDESLDQHESLIVGFTDSLSYRDDSLSILHLLENSLRRLPGLTCIVCEKFLERFSAEARDARTSRVGDAHTVTQLVFRVYHQHQADEWTTRALDLIDVLCLEAIGDARNEFDAFER